MSHLEPLRFKIQDEIVYVHIHLTYVHNHVSIMFMYDVHMKCKRLVLRYDITYNIYYTVNSILFMPNVFIVSWLRMKRLTLALFGGFGLKNFPPLPEKEEENIDVGQDNLY